jgi:hypothetical protein
MAGRLQSEWVADITPESPADIVGMLEGSTRSRDTDGAGGELRDVVEA